MFGKKKNKKSPKIEKLFDSSSTEEQSSADKNPDEFEIKEGRSDIDEFLGVEETGPDDNLTDAQKEKVDRLNTVKGKISQILQSQNIEIIDENIGDEYESDGSNNDEKLKQDYDSLKALFGDKSKSKKEEITLTIDDFDYTYVGQYLDEYDLMHMKSIKKIKLQRKYPKWLKKSLIAASIVSVLAVGGVMIYLFTKEKPVYLKSVTLNQTERDYLIGSEFDYTKLYFIAEYSDGNKKYVTLTKDHLVDKRGHIEPSGDDGTGIKFEQYSADTALVFEYEGFNVEYKINVIRKTLHGMQAVYAPAGVFGVAENGFISEKMLELYFIYNKGTEHDVTIQFPFSETGLKLYVDDVECLYVAGKGFKIENGTSSESKIVFVYTKDRDRIDLTLKNDDIIVSQYIEK